MTNTEPSNQEELQGRVTELETEVHDLEKDLIHDPLTGLKTRAFFEEEFGVYLKAMTQNELGKRREWFGFKNISIIFFDIDHFKKVNDMYGHDVGDIVLKKVAEVIRSTLRIGDTVSRWGGEEMVACLLGASESNAETKAEEIRVKVAAISFPEAPDLHLTISSGVSSIEDSISVKEIIKTADDALYAAKSAGRNRVVAHSSLKEK